jgi:hypothetical protein
LNIQEATWLVELPDRVLSTAKLIGYQAQALAKHRQHVKDMQDQANKRKQEWLLKSKKGNQHTIKDLNL